MTVLTSLRVLCQWRCGWYWLHGWRGCWHGGCRHWRGCCGAYATLLHVRVACQEAFTIHAGAGWHLHCTTVSQHTNRAAGRFGFDAIPYSIQRLEHLWPQHFSRTGLDHEFAIAGHDGHQIIRGATFARDLPACHALLDHTASFHASRFHAFVQRTITHVAADALRWCGSGLCGRCGGLKALRVLGFEFSILAGELLRDRFLWAKELADEAAIGILLQPARLNCC